ncbi:hypothetical protein [Trichlorobacter lovleyi]|uniref:Uncharacterized protein n=1 Tax=Trichlorobacter lovleyi (strain ATCC BAA-1151 / DSM 17278 / SZ) TaxID=398767 RepID=B3E3I7_TRIL1|nr:hypothetical protein [Trichlorobacter lovleyi]ACD95806.1 conserved hypothetical protein [Trichlorobacter lovleyi SZ]
MNSLRIPVALLVSGLLCYGLLIVPFSSYMANKPIEEKLGYVPSVKLLKPLSADQKELVGASLVMKVLMYFGGIIGKAQEDKVISEPLDLQGMSRLLHGAVQLDPYNMDAYYFAQGFLTWDAKQFKVANDLLDYGMKYRTWDWYLPFFAGFNSAYFLKDYPKAAAYYKRAADLSGQELHKSLAGRYMQESGQTDLAIAYLTVIEKGERNQSIKKDYQIRLAAFYEVKRIEIARDRFMAEHGGLPVSVEQLVQLGLLAPAPADPYGGRFYLEPSGKVTTTSKFAFATKNK